MDRMEAEFEVRQLHARYAHAIYGKDAETVGALFTEDGEWRVGGQLMKGREEIVSFLGGVFPQFSRILMIFSTPVVDVVGDEVTSRTFVTERSQFADGRPFSPIGIYFDRFAQVDGRLAFKWRLFQTQYSGLPDLASPFLEVPDYGPPPAMPPLDEVTLDRSGVGGKAKGG
ncbi:MAG: nuclear transport factor 2 family protein [Novosphingobium sp.]|nr:nuclear transport factor 2 family protein [Novosphingobium sp.]